jgi:SSS family transporter
MQVYFIDWVIIIAFFVLTLLIGLWASKRSGKSSAEFFLSGRNMPWWLLGVSMVATTFSADTPNLVTDIVRKNGVAGNWVWWAFLLTGTLTVFVYAKLWRRSGILTDLEFYELRYSGKPAAFLRIFRALYLGVIFNIVVMASVCLAGIKIGSVMFGLSPIQTLLLASVVTVIYSSMGGLRGIIFTDFFQFILAMAGTVIAAIFVLNMPEIGGLSNLLEHPEVKERLNLIPSTENRDLFYTIFLIPLAVQWWASYYPGAEPGGGGYVAQRMLSAKNESHAVGATFLFNIAHYALRPWPWILIALASVIVFPDLESIGTKFTHVDRSVINDDLAYPAMLSFLPKGLLGVVVASLIAGFMSTISSHLNWGSSYFVNDVYKRFFNPEASEKSLVLLGRVFTVVLMVFAAILALFLENALQAFNVILLIGAGTGLIFILRWFWWRINAYSEITAMVVSFLVALYFEFIYDGGMADYQRLLTNIVITSIAWITVTYATPKTDSEVLVSFYKRIKPFSLGWKPIIEQEGLETYKKSMNYEMSAIVLGCAIVYGFLLGMGLLIYGQWLNAGVAIAAAVLASWMMKRIWNHVV